VIYRIFVALVFIAIIVGSVLLGSEAPENVATTTVDERAGDLGYSARDTRMIETGPDGRPMYTIEASLIHEPPQSTTVFLTQVRLGFKDTNGNQWQGRADAGELGQNTKQVKLSGNVQITGKLPAMSDTATIATDELAIDTGADTVETDEPLTVTWAGYAIRSKGLTANLKDRVVHLKSNVHGTYAR
jgi:LPS export ABC transporter protein LptC